MRVGAAVSGATCVPDPVGLRSQPTRERRHQFPDVVPGGVPYGVAVESEALGLDIKAGVYDVILISSDVDRGDDGGAAPEQLNEQWRLLGDTNSDYSLDLLDTVDDIFNQVTYGRSVTFNSPTTALTAEHCSVAKTSHSADSVVPQAACLTWIGGPEED